jgi:uncharacterized protein YuzE
MSVRCVVDVRTGTLYVLFGDSEPNDSTTKMVTPLDDAPWIAQGVDSGGRISVISVAHAMANCAPGALPLATANVCREYDPEVDILTIHLIDPQDNRHALDCGGCLTDATGGVIYDVDAEQRLLSIEFLYASKKIRGF